MRRELLLITVIALAGCSRIDEGLNRFQRVWDNSKKTVTIYSQTGMPVKVYDIGRGKVTRSASDSGYIYFYANGKYIQTNMPYIVEGQ